MNYQGFNQGVNFDRRPDQQPFPSHQFSLPARYHDPNQKFMVGDLVWYEIRGNFDIHSGGIQWGEGIIKEILPENHYRLAGKAWSYDHLTHPLIGEEGGPPNYFSVNDISVGRDIYKRWAISHHPNSHVRRMALSGVDEVHHPAISRVPGKAMFKVWDREVVPTCPIPSMVSPGNSINPSRGEDFPLQEAKDIYGEDLQFQGMRQNGFGPEFWGITLDQLLAIKGLPGYRDEMKMYDIVNKLIKPQTAGKGMGYALLLNKEKPLRAKQMTSHAWGEQYSHFIKALKDSQCEGPFWVCAMAIYQEDAETIAMQLGPSIENGPFATVLKQATSMVAVFTPAADIYLRMWCVLEIFVATKYGVPIKFAALNQQFRSGIENIYDAIYEHSKTRCQSINASCGQKSDEEQIRLLVNSTEGGFDILDSVVEWCKTMYYIGEVHHPGSVFKSKPAHLLLMGGSGKLDYLAKTLSSVALAMDRMVVDPSSDKVAKALQMEQTEKEDEVNDSKEPTMATERRICCSKDVCTIA